MKKSLFFLIIIQVTLSMAQPVGGQDGLAINKAPGYVDQVVGQCPQKDQTIGPLTMVLLMNAHPPTAQSSIRQASSG